MPEPIGDNILLRLRELEGRLAALRRIESVDAAVLSGLELLLERLREDIRITACDDRGSFSSEKWNGLTLTDRGLLEQRLNDIEVALNSLDRGPPDTKNLMHKRYATNAWIWGLTLYGIAVCVAVLGLIIWQWPHATGPRPQLPPSTVKQDPAPSPPGATLTPPGSSGVAGPTFGPENLPRSVSTPAGTVTCSVDAAGVATCTAGGGGLPSMGYPALLETKPQDGPREADVLIMVVLMGALGAALHLLSSLSIFIGNRSLVRSWVIFYLFMPLEGAGLAPIVYLALRVGVLASVSSNSTTSNLNFWGLYAVAGLTGLFARQAIEMLAEVFRTVFKRVPGKDPPAGGGILT